MTTARWRPDGTVAHGRYAASKVPVITAWFWIIKVLTTAMGEATSDYLAHRYDPYVVVPLGGLALLLTLAVQLSVRRYLTWVYWFTVVGVAVVGAGVADALRVEFKVPYSVSSAFFAVTLAVIFALWFWSERTLSIHSIRTRRRELFYWATVLATFALGTATGDLTARTLGLGFLSSGVLFAVVIAVPAIGNWKLRMNPIFAFWFAYVITRPLGASFADWMDMPRRIGGLGLGEGPVAVALTVPIVVGVAYLWLSRRDVEERASGPARTGSAARGGRHRLAAAPVRAQTAPAAADQFRPYGQQPDRGDW